jgi:hypothetical protein
MRQVESRLFLDSATGTCSVKINPVFLFLILIWR